jgi:hypothetical protein
MALPPASKLLLQFVDDEMLRAPLLFDQLVEGVHDTIRRALPGMNPTQRMAVVDLDQAVLAQRHRLAEYFMYSLREQVQAELTRNQPMAAQKPLVAVPKTLSLVDEEAVAVDVELSHTIEAIKSTAEYELRELQTFTAALVGDLEMAKDNNAFRAETFARAVWNSSQALPLSRSHQVAYMRYASGPLAQLLRTSYAASTSRLESMGVEPATYRTLILPSGSRRGSRSAETTYAPDLQRMSETMPAPLEPAPVSHHGNATLPVPGRGLAAQPLSERWLDVARGATQRADRQAIELVSRLFEAMMADARVPQDMTIVISRLHGPAMRLALGDRSLLDHTKHPLWHFINQAVFAAEMSPDPADPERLHLLKLCLATIDQLGSEAEQNSGLYRWALERLDAFLAKRMQRRLAGVASQVGALQKLEDKVMEGGGPPTTMSAPLDVHHLDTVPAELMGAETEPPTRSAAAGDWLNKLRAGDWVRMFFKGRWLHAQLLWMGERREFLLFGDGASDDTWAVRAGALQMLHSNGLVKTLKMRSIVGSAAAKVQEQLSASLSGA